VEGFPLHASLDKVSPNNPVILTHASGHATFVNGKALELAGVTGQTPNPSGGEILKDAKGNPTGLLRERASGVISRARADYEAKRTAADRREELNKSITLAIDESLSKGITTFEDAGSPFSTIDVLKKMAENHELRMRIWMMARVPNDQLAPALDRYRTIGAGEDFFTVRAIKRAIDGALGSRGAWLLEPYTDKPDSSGLNTDDPADIRKTAELAIQHGYQLCVHAIGDRANRETLNIFEETFKAHPEKKDLRWRIEHAQHINAADIPRFGRLGVIAAMQGVHCTSDAPYVLLRLGARRAEEGAYVWQKLMKSGAIVGNGTDAPVEDVSPLASFYASVSRKLKDGTVFYPDQRMSREEALKSYTVNNAYAAFEEKLKGSLETGKLADITVLSRDIMTIPEDEIPATDVVYTIVGGKIRFDRTANASAH
jgi:predicted amidohydrolase YtcJ